MTSRASSKTIFPFDVMKKKMPRSENLDEIQKIIEKVQTNKLD
jgi:hypothetical protein